MRVWWAHCVQVLTHWLQLLRQGELMSQFVTHLQQLVAQRCGAEAGAGGDAGSSIQQQCRQLLQEVQSLLQVGAGTAVRMGSVHVQGRAMVLIFASDF